MGNYADLKNHLAASPKTWLVTGVAGFIGSNLLETLLTLDQRVVGLDDFSTGKQRNLEDVRQMCGPARWLKFRLIEDTIGDLETCRLACRDVDYVLHHAAVASVARSLKDPISTNESNVNGFVNMLVAARDGGVRRFVYATSSAAYGDDSADLKVECTVGRPLSPYAVTKYADELYAHVFAQCYGFETIGLRYFNVFGPRQDPEGDYAAVIPKWIAALINRESIFLNGNGDTSRDFIFVPDAVQANLLAATAAKPEAVNQVYNVALNKRTTLIELFSILKELLLHSGHDVGACEPLYREFQRGDVWHSQADITKISELLGFSPVYGVREGLAKTLPWYIETAGRTEAGLAAGGLSHPRKVTGVMK
jgi:UDP-N-acetylglucosamine/UDP-N-acetylgalactosamine 4-epimerase